MIDTNIILHFLIIQEINESDFDNIFAQIIVMKDSDSLIKYYDVIKG